MEPDLYQSLTLTRNAVFRKLQAVLAVHDLSVNQYYVMELIATAQAMQPSLIASLLEIDAGAMTRIVDSLVTKGLIEREKVEVDRRGVYLRLLADGEIVYAQARACVAKVNQQVESISIWSGTVHLRCHLNKVRLKIW